jgi:hypothetical protein
MISIISHASLRYFYFYVSGRNKFKPVKPTKIDGKLRTHKLKKLSVICHRVQNYRYEYPRLNLNVIGQTIERQSLKPVVVVTVELDRGSIRVYTVCKLHVQTDALLSIYIYNRRVSSGRRGEMAVGGGGGNGVGGGRYNRLMFGTAQSISMQNNRCADTRP